MPDPQQQAVTTPIPNPACLAEKEQQNNEWRLVGGGKENVCLSARVEIVEAVSLRALTRERKRTGCASNVRLSELYGDTEPLYTVGRAMSIGYFRKAGIDEG
jgi:hypothetical protein